MRRGEAGAAGASIIAGYPWFADWGRDTMISLPGLATVTGALRHRRQHLEDLCRASSIAACCRTAFRTAARRREYNTADATLWMFHALEDYLAGEAQSRIARPPVPDSWRQSFMRTSTARALASVSIPQDGLLHVGEAGTQLTWMDAKHGEQVFTPRIGKPVEINALWLNALNVMVRGGRAYSQYGEKRFCETLLERATATLAAFGTAERLPVRCHRRRRQLPAMPAFDPIKSSPSPCPLAPCRRRRCARWLSVADGIC